VAKKESVKKTKTQRAIEPSVQDERVEASSGNVFADLGLPDAEELLVNATLAITVKELIEKRGGSQNVMSRHARLDQHKLTNLMRGRLSDYSSASLFTILNQLGHSVEVRISAEQRAPGKAHTHVTIA
jgi:predicted XRE-type DNA-binding protein